jgi:hypothetical protein
MVSSFAGRISPQFSHGFIVSERELVALGVVALHLFEPRLGVFRAPVGVVATTRVVLAATPTHGMVSRFFRVSSQNGQSWVGKL